MLSKLRNHAALGLLLLALVSCTEKHPPLSKAVPHPTPRMHPSPHPALRHLHHPHPAPMPKRVKPLSALPRAAMPEIVVGAVVAATGAHRYEGRAVRAGYEFWASWVNHHGGVRVGGRRYRIALVERDDESTPVLTSQLTERLINEEHVRYLLGPYGSAETLAGAAVAERKSIPFVTGTGASEKIFEQGYRHVFGIMAPARAYLRGMIDLAERLSPPRSVAVIAANDPFSLEAQQGALQRADDLGLHVIDRDQYPTGTMNFHALAAKLAKERPEMVLHAGHAQESIQFTRALYEANVEPKVHGETVGAELPPFSHLLGALSDDTWSAAQWSPSLPYVGSPALFPSSAPAYARAFAHFAKSEPNSLNASASAAGLALEAALVRARSLDPKRVTESLRTLDIHTFYGTLRFDARGLNAKKPMFVNQLEAGRRYLIAPSSLSGFEPVYPARPWRER
jgi:branched-chain amino acid transport system substrate-binding protein